MKYLPLMFFSFIVKILWADAAGFQDDFSTGTLNTEMWEVLPVGGEVSFKKREDETRLALRGEVKVLTTFIADAEGHTFHFNASSTWGATSRAIFLYQDSDNYFSLGISHANRGLYQMVQGEEVKLDTDPLQKLSLPHAGFASGNYSIYTENNGKELVIRLDRQGDGVKVDTLWSTTDPEIVKRFVGGRIGFMGAQQKAQETFGEVAIANGHIAYANPNARIYYVNAEKGDDTRTSAQAADRETPWRTIQKAANEVGGGNVVKVAPGIYREMVVFPNRGGPLAPVVFQAEDPENRPVITGAEPVNVGEWEAVILTDFRGRKQKALRTEISFAPRMVFQGNLRMMVAQEPNQKTRWIPMSWNSFCRYRNRALPIT
ncbi:hypothetical protein P0Y35_02330 [Kiritimatiellaeota bacterium B1221]|nr:hypothetical protein [Kiritimatiellaeota bacterium B1221]